MCTGWEDGCRLGRDIRCEGPVMGPVSSPFHSAGNLLCSGPYTLMFRIHLFSLDIIAVLLVHSGYIVLELSLIWRRKLEVFGISIANCESDLSITTGISVLYRSPSFADSYCWRWLRVAGKWGPWVCGLLCILEQSYWEAETAILCALHISQVAFSLHR